MPAPVSQTGAGKIMFGTTKPIAKRLKKAASNACFLSGKSIGSMVRTAISPKAVPATKPVRTFIRFPFALSRQSLAAQPKEFLPPFFQQSLGLFVFQ